MSANRFSRDLVEGVRLLVVAGIPVGVLVAGVGSRLAMLLLRLTSPDSVSGVRSDDGFIIGKVTLAGTYNLLVLGAGVGIIGAAAYQWVRPWLLGPWWFRRATTAVGSGVVVGSMLLHADGIDFRVLTPTWLAIGLFVALPALFGLAIGPAVDRIGRPGSWTRRWFGWRGSPSACSARSRSSAMSPPSPPRADSRCETGDAPLDVGVGRNAGFLRRR